MNATDIETTDIDSREQRINLAIFDYHMIVDRRETLDLKSWLKEHEDIEDELRNYIEDLKEIGTATVVDASQRHYQEGEILGDYRLLEKIAEGGQGVVWKASPCRFSEVVVAIKTMSTRFFDFERTRGPLPE